MKWTYEQYMNNPKWFNDILEIKINIEVEETNKKHKKNG